MFLKSGATTILADIQGYIVKILLQNTSISYFLFRGSSFLNDYLTYINMYVGRLRFFKKNYFSFAIHIGTQNNCLVRIDCKNSGANNIKFVYFKCHF